MARAPKKTLRTGQTPRRSVAELKERFGPQTVPSDKDFADLIDLAESAAQAFTPGTIMMFAGDQAPAGWVTCDDSPAAREAHAPDLTGRFILGCGPEQQTQSSEDPARIGGEWTWPVTIDAAGWEMTADLAGTALAEEHMPVHSHANGVRWRSTLGEVGSTVRTYIERAFDEEVVAASGRLIEPVDAGNAYLGPTLFDFPGVARRPRTSIAGGGTHTHTTETGSGAHGHEAVIKPPYYSLTFIMKLPYESV